MAAVKGARALVLEEMRPSGGVLFVARRPSPAAIPGDVDGERRL